MCQKQLSCGLKERCGWNARQLRAHQVLLLLGGKVLRKQRPQLLLLRTAREGFKCGFAVDLVQAV